MMWAVVRVRGLKDVKVDIRKTLELLNLDRKNHCVILQSKEETEGMLKKARDYIAYGPIRAPTLAQLLRKRGRLSGDQRMTIEYLKNKKLNSFDDAANTIIEGKKTLRDMGVKNVFRLNAPRKGFSRFGIKKGVELRGPLGYHAEGLDTLLEKMM